MYKSESLNPHGDYRYVFGRHALSSVRLNFQHFWFTHLTGNELLHKSVRERIDFSTPLRVADIGTGTAIWPINLATSQPNWQCDGFDVSGDQYPPAGRVPANVSLHKHDTFTPYPEEYHGKYDIVNIRFMMTLLSKEKMPLMLQNVRALLKPGGILQWMESNSHLATAIAPEGVSTTHTSIMADMMTHNPPDGPEYASFYVDWVYAMGTEEVSHELEQEGDIAKANGLKDLLKGLKEEAAQGACVETP